VQSFSYSPRLKDHPEVARDFLTRAGAGGQAAAGLPVAVTIALDDLVRRCRLTL
jgi:hypothetical protein